MFMHLSWIISHKEGVDGMIKFSFIFVAFLRILHFRIKLNYISNVVSSKISMCFYMFMHLSMCKYNFLSKLWLASV